MNAQRYIEFLVMTSRLFQYITSSGISRSSIFYGWFVHDFA